MKNTDLRNVGYVEDSVDSMLMAKIKKTVEEIKESINQQKSFAGNLVGNIRKQFVFDHFDLILIIGFKMNVIIIVFYYVMPVLLFFYNHLRANSSNILYLSHANFTLRLSIRTSSSARI